MLTVEDYVVLLFVISLFNLGLATILFSRITMRYIDRKLKEEQDNSAEWDGKLGMRIIHYAMAITARKPQDISLVNENLVKKHARRIDMKLAWYHNLSVIVFFLLMLILYLFF